MPSPFPDMDPYLEGGETRSHAPGVARVTLLYLSQSLFQASHYGGVASGIGAVVAGDSIAAALW